MSALTGSGHLHPCVQIIADIIAVLEVDIPLSPLWKVEVIGKVSDKSDRSDKSDKSDGSDRSDQSDRYCRPFIDNSSRNNQF